MDAEEANQGVSLSFSSIRLKQISAAAGEGERSRDGPRRCDGNPKPARFSHFSPVSLRSHSKLFVPGELGR